MRGFFIALLSLLIVITMTGLYKLIVMNDDSVFEYTTTTMRYNTMETLKMHCKNMPDVPTCQKYLSNQSYKISSGNNEGNNQDNILNQPIVTDELSLFSELIFAYQSFINVSTDLLRETSNPRLKELLSMGIDKRSQDITILREWIKRYYNDKYYTTQYTSLMRDSSTISSITTIEKMYIEDMILHHQLIIDMVTDFWELSEKQDSSSQSSQSTMNHYNEIKRFTRQIVVDHNKEISEFKSILKMY